MRNKIYQDIDRKYYPNRSDLLELGKICEDFMRGTIGLLYPRKHMAT